MEGIWPRDGSFGDTVRAGDDEVVLLKVKQLDSQRKQWEVKPVSLVEERELLDKTGNNSLLFDSLQVHTTKDSFPSQERLSLDLVALSRWARAVFVAEKPYVPPLANMRRI